MRKLNKTVLFGLYNDEDVLMDAITAAQQKNVDIWDVFTPFPVHGLDKHMGMQESRLHIAGFVYGLTGTLTAFLFMTWVFTQDWPTVFGGKPYFSFPAFVPIMFELTVLFSAVGMTVTFYVVNGLGPGVENPYLHPRITDDKFCMAFDVTDRSEREIEEIRSLLKSTHAEEVQTKSI
jgi:hypothetical protein